MNSKRGIGRATLVAVLLIIIVIAAVVAATYAAGFLNHASTTKSSTKVTTSIATEQTTSTSTSTLATLTIPVSRTFPPNILDLFGNFSAMSVVVSNSTHAGVENTSTTERITFGVANETTTSANITAAVGFNYNLTTVSNGVRSSYSNVSIAFILVNATNPLGTFTLVDENGTLFFGQEAQTLGGALIAPFQYLMGIGLPLASTNYTSTAAGHLLQNYTNFAMQETNYTVCFQNGASAAMTVGDYASGAILLVG